MEIIVDCKSSFWKRRVVLGSISRVCHRTMSGSNYVDFSSGRLPAIDGSRESDGELRGQSVGIVDSG